MFIGCLLAYPGVYVFDIILTQQPRTDMVIEQTTELVAVLADL